jgi:ribosome biogenesis GTPase
MDTSAAVIESVILRRNEIARKVAGKQATKQIIAANVDIAFVLLALDNDFSIERLQRFLYQLSNNAIEPVIVLNKADKTDNIPSYIEQIRSLNLPIIVCSATEGVGIDEVMERILPGRTAILLGSSGVGKSTLTNKLLQREAQLTNEVRASDSTGRHTTVHREIFVLPNGGLLIDTPGIRELQLWGTEGDLDTKYNDISEISKHCKYADCHHDKESGCAIRKALQNGTLDKKHYANYLKMKWELADLAKKQSARIQKDNKRPRRNTYWQQDEE